MIELEEIMQQKDDQQFTEILNQFRTAYQTQADLLCFSSRSISPSDALHIWAENDPVMEHNNLKS